MIVYKTNYFKCTVTIGNRKITNFAIFLVVKKLKYLFCFVFPSNITIVYSVSTNFSHQIHIMINKNICIIIEKS